MSPLCALIRRCGRVMKPVSRRYRNKGFYLSTGEYTMSFKSAQQFVSRMKEDLVFRDTVQTLPDSRKLNDYLKQQGFDFDDCDLVKAMAACMAELEKK
jgi:predicted ribosomally synthesized peptide with nif11-like leader